MCVCVFVYQVSVQAVLGLPQFNTLRLMFALNCKSIADAKGKFRSCSQCQECIANLPHMSVQIISWQRVHRTYWCSGVCFNIGNVLTSKVDYLIIHLSCGNANQTRDAALCSWLWHQMTAKAKRLALAINWNFCRRLAGAAPLNHHFCIVSGRKRELLLIMNICTYIFITFN